MSIPGDKSLSYTIMKFNEEFEYINSKLKIIRTKVSSIHQSDREHVNTPKDYLEGTSNLSSLRGIKNEEPENKSDDLCNVVTKTVNSDIYPKTNLSNMMPYMNMVPINSVDMFSKFMGYQCGTSSIDKETIKKNFVDSSMLMYKAKKTARETDLYLKKLNNNVLPRCLSADITSDIVNCRNIDAPSKITSESQYILKKQLDKNILKTNEKSMKILKPNPKSHCEEIIKNAHEIKVPQDISCTSNLTESIKKNSMRNVGIVNIGYEDKIPEEEENNCDKLKNLTVQKIPRVDLKPDLVTQKLTNIQIKPGNKKTVRSHLIPNVAYSKFTFESESQTCACQPIIQPGITKNKKIARNEIRKILCEMLKNKSSNDELTNQLKKILNNLEETNPLMNNFSSQLENLVEQHSMVDLNENIIKNVILEIAENIFDNENDGLPFDEMSIEIERNSQQLLQRLAKIKNSILASINPMIKFSKNENQQDHDVINNADENHTIQHPNNNFNLRNFQNNDFKDTDRFVSIREYLNQGFNNSVYSKMFENVSVVKESDSKITLCSKNSIIPNPNAFSIINTLNDNTIPHQLKKYQPKSKNEDLSQITAFEEEHENYDKMSKQSTQEIGEIETDGESSTMNSIDLVCYVLE